MTDARTVGGMLEEYRRRQAVTKTALAASAGVPLSYLIKVLDGRSTLTMERLERLVESLHLTEAEAAKLRVANLRARSNAEGLELERLALAGCSREAGVPEDAIPVKYVPIVSRVPAGNPAEFTDGEYPAGFAEEYIGVPEPLVRKHPGAFALRIEGDSMMPRFRHDDIIIVGPHSAPQQGKPAVVKVRGEVTCKLWYRGDGTVSLKPLNPDYPDQHYKASEVEWAYPVTLVISAV